MSSTTIATIKTQALANIQAITANPKPSYSIDGQMVSWGDYLRTQTELVEWCDKQLAGETPFEHHTVGYVPGGLL